MPAILPKKLFSMGRAADPKTAILEAIGDAVDKITVANNLVLVGTYISSDVMSRVKTDQGKTVELIRADTNKAEDLWMGCMGLVLKHGPRAFKDEPELNIFWHGQTALVGQWVLFRYSSAWETHLADVSVRFVEDREIKAITDDPSIIIGKRSAALGG